MNLSGKTALVTGGSRGIGRAIAIEFAKQGAAVALIGRDVDALAESARLCAGARPGAVAELFAGDVADLATVERIAADVLARFGRIDCAVAGAGQSVDALLLRLKSETIDRMLDVTSSRPSISAGRSPNQ
jgi:3-oxoacyl-[acyl-carrier protein] reductase